jgi:hypothetical protein
LQLGYGEWTLLRAAIRRSDAFRFDYFFKSRNELELNRRVDVLVRQLQKKSEEETKKSAKAGASEAAAGGDVGSKRKQAVCVCVG